MSANLIEFNSTELVNCSENVTNSFITDKDVIFNESYIVIGTCTKAAKVYATYDLSVHGDLQAEEIFVNGSLFVSGNIDAARLECRGKLICIGNMRVAEVASDGFMYAESVTGDDVNIGGDLLVHTTIDTDHSLQVDGLIVAAEGIMGDGTLNAKASIANEYFEFAGDHKGNVFEIASMAFSDDSNSTKSAPPSENLSNTIDRYKILFDENVKDWYDLDEDDLIDQLFKIELTVPKLQTVTRLIDKIVDISYTNRLTNLRDYLFAIWAMEEFPDAVLHYYTIQGVFDELVPKAREELSSLEFRPESIRDIADALYVISKYSAELGMPFEKCADKIFSSIGLRYSTVEHILEVQQ